MRACGGCGAGAYDKHDPQCPRLAPVKTWRTALRELLGVRR